MTSEFQEAIACLHRAHEACRDDCVALIVQSIGQAIQCLGPVDSDAKVREARRVALTTLGNVLKEVLEFERCLKELEWKHNRARTYEESYNNIDWYYAEDRRIEANCLKAALLGLEIARDSANTSKGRIYSTLRAAINTLESIG